MTALPQIEQRLREAAERLDAAEHHDQERAAPSRGGAPRGRRVRWSAGRALAAAAAIAVGAFVVVTAIPSPQLAILQTATADASAMARELPGVVGKGTRADRVHPFATPNGRGFAFETHDDDLCVVLPDSVPDSYGSSCARLDEVRSRGLMVSLAIERGARGSGLVVVVLPGGVGSASWKPAGAAAIAQRPENGVVVLSARDGTLSWRTRDGTTRSERVLRYLPQGRRSADCGGGRIVSLPAGTRLSADAIADACRR